MAKKKKSGSHLGVVVGLSVFLVALFAALAVCAWYFMFREDPQKATQHVYDMYVEAVASDNYEAIYPMVHEDVQAQIDKETVLNRYGKILDGIGAQNIEFNLISGTEDEDGSGWTYKYTMSMDSSAGKLEDTYSMKICKDSEKQYKIMWSSNLIFPHLDETDKVRVNTLSGDRGTIYDCEGNVLACDGKGASAGLVPGKISEQTRAEDLEKMAELLEVSVEYIEEQLSAAWVTDDVFVPVRSIAPDKQELIDQLLEIPGVMINTTHAREYPYGEVLAHLTGYVQGISDEELTAMAQDGYDSTSIVGKSGLEKLYESSLRSVDGCEIIIIQSDGEVKETLAYRAAQNGKDVHLTLSARLCKILYDQLGADAGTAVALNTKTGEVMALTSTPSYNPNEFVAGITTSAWDALNANEKMPFYNRYTASFVPGSSFKPVTAAIGLTNGTIDANEVSPSNGLSWQKDSSWGNLFVTTLQAYGDVTVKSALAYSDNIYFAKQALNIGQNAFVQGLDGLGFNEALPFTLALTPSTYGALSEASGDLLLANSGYGQGEILVNPIHLAAIYTAFSNGGNILLPHMISNASELGAEQVDAGTVWKAGVFSEAAVETVNDGLKAVISEGTGTSAQACGIALAGKTGTAEIKASQDDTSGTELGWFAAYETENAQDPLLILMMVEDVKDRDGSHYVIPKVAEAFSQYRQ